MRNALSTASGLVGTLLIAGLATAAPANDERTAPQIIGALPALIEGTTATASTNATDPPAGCGGGPNVWYQVTATSDQPLVAAVQANGDLDVGVAVYRRQRSQLTLVDCETSDEQGRAQVGVPAKKDQAFLVAVSQLPNSVPGSFGLQVFAPIPPAAPPGRPLPGTSIRQNVNRLRNPSDAWSTRLEAGTTYRVNLVTDGRRCAGLRVYGPNPTTFEEPVLSRGCGGYTLFTPGEEGSGRYDFVVDASLQRRGTITYRLSVAPTLADDTTPGLSLANDVPVRGLLRGARADVVDIYNFDVPTRSDLSFTLGTRARTNIAMRLTNDSGSLLGEGSTAFTRRLRPGRYFLAVRAGEGVGGSYVLRRLARVITSSVLNVDEGRRAAIAPGETARVSVAVSPNASGPVRLVIERFEPFAGWQFHRAVSLRAVAGQASYAFTPAKEGRYRLRANFVGTRGASPSDAGTAQLRVVRPLPPP